MNDPSEVLRWLEAPVSLKSLVSKLSFDLDGFEMANLEQPKLSLEAGRYRTKAVLEKARAELRLEVGEAEIAQRLREKSSVKLTEKALAERLAQEEEVIKLKKRAYMAKVMDEWAKQLLEAYNQRLQVLNNITKIRTGEIASNLRAVKEEAAVKQMNSVRREAEKVRKRVEQDDED